MKPNFLFVGQAPDEQFGRVSYTQYELLYAKSKDKRVYHPMTEGSLPRDQNAAKVNAS